VGFGVGVGVGVGVGAGADAVAPEEEPPPPHPTSGKQTEASRQAPSVRLAGVVTKKAPKFRSVRLWWS
jgi:hypothetical protein